MGRIARSFVLFLAAAALFGGGFGPHGSGPKPDPHPGGGSSTSSNTAWG